MPHDTAPPTARPGWSRRHLLGLRGLSAADLADLLDRADGYRDAAGPPERILDGLTAANLFFEPSTRTLTSFSLAARRLGAETVEFVAGGSSLSKGETVSDTALTIESMGVDFAVVRHRSAGVPHRLAGKLRAAVLNAGDGTHEHPTQALIDLMTLRRELGDLSGRTVAVVGDILHSRVARSNILGLKALGARVICCGPPTLLPGHLPGVELTTDLDAALEDADAVNLLRVQFERQRGAFFPSPGEYARLFAVTGERLRRVGVQPLVLAPGPVNRGIELSTDVADGPRSRIREQVANGVWVRMACLAVLHESRGANP